MTTTQLTIEAGARAAARAIAHLTPYGQREVLEVLEASGFDLEIAVNALEYAATMNTPPADVARRWRQAEGG